MQVPAVHPEVSAPQLPYTKPMLHICSILLLRHSTCLTLTRPALPRCNLLRRAGECNQALAQQALVLREHMAQRDAETAALVSELQSARVGG
jgi:hypothetical protein